jgi:hypothetical protein
MNTLPRRLGAWGAALLLGATLTGCVVAPAHRYGGGYVTVAPPAPYVDVVGVAPGPGYFWVNGYWGWKANRHVWTDGRWEQRRPGYRWQPHAWQRDGNRYRETPGRWQPQ